jgi:hypothetical protein
VAGTLIPRLLRLLSLALCLVAVAWFVAFALEQSKGASAHQQAEVNQAAPPGLAMTPTQTASGNKSGLHEAVDDAFSRISSPFSGLTSGIDSQWTLHAVDTLLALLIYGFGLGFIARVLRFSG